MDVGPTDGGSAGGSFLNKKTILIAGGALIAIILAYKWYTNRNSSNTAGVATDGTLNTNTAGSDQASTGTSNPPVININVQQPAQPVPTTTGTKKKKPVLKPKPVNKPGGGGGVHNIPPHAPPHPNTPGHVSINKNIHSSDAVGAYSGKIAPSSSPTPSAGTTRSA
jgi:hypothetical protein